MNRSGHRDWPKTAALLLVDESPTIAADFVHGVMDFVRGRPDWAIDIMSRERLMGCRDRLTGVIGFNILAELETVVRQRRLPLVTVLSMLSPAAAAATILLNDEAVGEMGAAHFRECGLERVLYMGIDRPFSHARAKGFARFVRREGRLKAAISSGPCITPPWTYLRPLYQRTIGRILRTVRPPVGIMAWNDDAARLVVEESLAQGLRVPDDVAVIGVDNDSRFCELREPTITSINVDRRRMGYEAMASLDRVISGTIRTSATVWITPSAVERRASTDFVHVDDELVARALHLIRERATTDISPSDVVKALGVSRSSLGKRFTAVRGRTIGQEIRRARLAKAQELLGDQDLPLLEVATRCGFADLPHFCNVFRRGTGTTPGRYRASARQRGASNARRGIV